MRDDVASKCKVSTWDEGTEGKSDDVSTWDEGTEGKSDDVSTWDEGTEGKSDDVSTWDEGTEGKSDDVTWEAFSSNCKVYKPLSEDVEGESEVNKLQGRPTSEEESADVM